MELRIEYVPISRLVPYAGNAKIHTPEQVGHIANSMQEFGNCDPIGVWENESGQLEIVERHGRFMALEQIGAETAPVIRLDHLTDEQRRAYTHVHNQTTLTTGFDMHALDLDLAELAFDWEALGFDAIRPLDLDAPSTAPAECPECGAELVDGTCPACGWNAEYDEFVEKFAPKKTTDDCYTPPAVYDAVLAWAVEEYGVDPDRVVRPFWPGGDYTAERYEGAVVVDNPPFSILSEIVRFYAARGVDFLLFAPSLTLFTAPDCDVCYIATGCNVEYENGAVVKTSFVTSLDRGTRIRTAPALFDAVEAAGEREPKACLRFEYPPEVVTSTMVQRWSELGVEWSVPAREASYTRALDMQREHGKGIYGGGYLLSDRARAEADRARAEADRARAEADRARAEADRTEFLARSLGFTEISEDGAVVWALSDRERAIVDGLGK